MLVSLAPDVVLLVPFDSHRHAPLFEHISLVIGFDGVNHVVTESISHRMISHALKNLLTNHQPFAFGFLNVDNHTQILAKNPRITNANLTSYLQSKIASKLEDQDMVEPLNDNEFAVILHCHQNIDEVLPRLWELSNLSNTPVKFDESEITVGFSAGYVLVTDSFMSAKEILDEAISMMYKSKSDGKNGFSMAPFNKPKRGLL